MNARIRRTGLMSKSLFYAIVVHLIVGVLLVLNIDWPAQAVSPPASQPAPVQANVVSETEIQKQMEAIKEKEDAKKEKQLEAERKLEELLNRRKEEEARLTEIKERQAEEERKAEQAAKQKEQKEQELAKLDQEREQERKREEEERRKQAEAEAERQRQAAEEQRQKELAAKREREDELKNQIEAERLQRRVDSLLSQYVPIIKQKVSRNWNQPAGTQTNGEAHVDVRLSQTGEVISARVVKSSGNQVFDRSVENAVLKASPLPIPQERGVNEQFRNLRLRFKPEELIS